MEQRSKEWFDARRGKATSSKICLLMGVKGLGLTGEGYAFEKAIEEVFGEDEEEQFQSSDMKRGVELEPLAFRKFQELSPFDDVTSVGFVLMKGFEDHSGSSPDGLVNNNALLEIKCPRPTKFFKLVAAGNDINAIDKDYLYQMQHQMLVTGREKCYFMNYIIYNGVEMWHIMGVNADADIQEKINTRIEEFVKLKNEYKEYLINHKQF